MSDRELLRLLAAEKEATERYSRIKSSFGRNPEVVESARFVLVEATAALVRYQEMHGG
jgi:hypothetical protein